MVARGHGNGLDRGSWGLDWALVAVLVVMVVEVGVVVVFAVMLW